MSYMIFSIDNVFEVHTLAKFLRYIDTLKHSSQLEGNMELCIGSWEGKLEYSFIMLTSDFQKYVVPLGWVDNQESTLQLYNEKGNRYSTFEVTQGKLKFFGIMQQVTKEEALASTGWTYRPDLDAYFVTRVF